MWFGVLGSLTAGQPPRPLAGKVERRVLAALLIDAGRLVTTDRLVDVVWGERPPRTCVASLQVRISNLRRVTGRERIVSEAAGYRVVVDPDDVDAFVFERLLSEGRRELASGRPRRADELLTAAIDLWRGPAYADVAYEAFAGAEAARLEGLRVVTRDERIDARLGSGLAADVIAELEALVASEPLRERPWAQLMRALYLCGRQADALRAFRVFTGHLTDVGIDPSPAIRTLEQAILLRDPALGALPLDATQLGRSAVTTTAPDTDVDANLIGRASELALLEATLRPGTLVTLTGPGGVGKTALAKAVARRLGLRTDRRPLFVSLESVQEEAEVAAQVMMAVGSAEEPEGSAVDSIVNRFANEPRLLVLDNAEHLLGALRELVGRLLDEAEQVCILVTSREPLGLPAEIVMIVECLEVPQDGLSEVEILAASAVQLFLRRGSQARPGFTTSPADADVVARICQRLDGLPLAVELAASRLSVLSLGELDQRLLDRFRLLGTGRPGERRHDSLRAVIAWSFELLDDLERAVLRRMSVFRGGATLIALEDVCGTDPVPVEAVLDVLGRLVRKSLVVVDRDGPTTRYRLLELVREYALGELDREGDGETTRRRHLEWALSLAAQIEAAMSGNDEARWGAEGRLEHANLLGALHLAWTDESCSGLFVELAGRLRQFWESAGMFSEAELWLDRAIAVEGQGDVHRVRALIGAGRLADRHGDWPTAAGHYHEALALARELGESRWEANSLNNLSYVAYAQGDNNESLRLVHAALSIARPADDLVNEARAYAMAGLIAESTNDLDEAERNFLTALELSRRQDSPAFTCQGLANLGDLAQKRGDLSTALTWNEEALALARQLQDPALLAISLVNTGECRGALGDVAAAREMVEEAIETSRTLGMPMIELAAMACKAQLLAHEGDVHGVIDAAQQSARAARRYRTPHILTDTLIQNATTVASVGERELADTLLAEAEAVARKSGDSSQLAKVEQCRTNLSEQARP